MIHQNPSLHTYFVDSTPLASFLVDEQDEGDCIAFTQAVKRFQDESDGVERVKIAAQITDSYVAFDAMDTLDCLSDDTRELIFDTFRKYQEGSTSVIPLTLFNAALKEVVAYLHSEHHAAFDNHSL